MRLVAITVVASLIGFVIVSSLKPQPQSSLLKAQLGGINTTLKTVNPTAIQNYLSNPGIGWQEAHTFSNPLLPETVAYRRPQYSWKLQNPQEGIYNFASLDGDIATATSQGKQFSFRIYTANSQPQIPDWVISKGASIKGSNPDYSSCVYQDEWGKFVNAMRERYDGNSNIAFIDISGYGNYNEWSWTDGQTTTDPNYLNPVSLDGQGRKRLADMFIGGSGTVKCKDNGGQTQTVSYSYPGFSRTQLVMPYAGIQQSSHYVNYRRPDVGFRNDCLGRQGNYQDITSKVGDVISRIWPVAPVVYEFCGDTSTTSSLLAQADLLLKWSHGSITHDNFSGTRSFDGLTSLLKNVGYRYLVKQASFVSEVVAGKSFNVKTIWSNVGSAPNYPRLGQTFKIHYYLVDQNGTTSVDSPSLENTALWLPGEHEINPAIDVPASLPAGTYSLKVALIDLRTGKSINLAFDGRDSNGRYLLDTINVVSAQKATTTATPTPTPISQSSSTPTPIPTLVSTPTPSPLQISQAVPTPSPVSKINREVVAGVSTNKVTVLPKTGESQYPALISLILIPLGYGIKKRFKLVT